MGDRTAHQVYVYDCPPEQVSAVQEVLEPYYWDEVPEGGPVSACHQYFMDEMTCGTSAEIAKALREAAPGVSFVLWEDPKYDWLGEVHAYTPELGAFREECDANGQPVMYLDAAKRLITEATETGADVIETLAKAMGEPWLADWEAKRDAAHGGQQ